MGAYPGVGACLGHYGIINIIISSDAYLIPLSMSRIIIINFSQLLELTCKVANVLKDNGINKGDRVIIYMPAMPLAVAAMLACTRMGAVHW